MALFEMCNKLAIMPQTDLDVTINGNTFTVPANTPFSSSLHQIEITGPVTLAVMYNTQSTSGKTLQVFSVDDVVTVA